MRNIICSKSNAAYQTAVPLEQHFYFSKMVDWKIVKKKRKSDTAFTLLGTIANAEKLLFANRIYSGFKGLTGRDEFSTSRQKLSSALFEIKICHVVYFGTDGNELFVSGAKRNRIV